MTRIDLPTKTLCWHPGRFVTFPNADAFCGELRAQICTLAQWRAAVCMAGVQNPGRSWTYHPTGQGGFAIIGNCSLDSMSDLHWSSQVQGPCCVEWPRY
ncbi:MAG: hypothetical protein F9K40_21270 [Kofleriaceae bacterium]|nr:MAG: hypothetical protein F9K40_21270 [Kofleriaceae bacterium]